MIDFEVASQLQNFKKTSPTRQNINNKNIQRFILCLHYIMLNGSGKDLKPKMYARISIFLNDLAKKNHRV